MKFLPTIIGTSYDCTAKDPNRSQVFVFSKLVEEMCELSDVFHNIAKSEPLNGEVADVIISAVDLLYVMEFNSVQTHGSMTKEEVIDSVIHRLTVAQGVSSSLEDFWFSSGCYDPEKIFPRLTHLQGRVTRLLNQPHRCTDTLEDLLVNIISATATVAMSVGDMSPRIKNGVRIKVEHAVEHKVEKWRGKFGL